MDLFTFFFQGDFRNINDIKSRFARFSPKHLDHQFKGFSNFFNRGLGGGSSSGGGGGFQPAPHHEQERDHGGSPHPHGGQNIGFNDEFKFGGAPTHQFKDDSQEDGGKAPNFDLGNFEDFSQGGGHHGGGQGFRPPLRSPSGGAPGGFGGGGGTFGGNSGGFREDEDGDDEGYDLPSGPQDFSGSQGRPAKSPYYSDHKLNEYRKEEIHGGGGNKNKPELNLYSGPDFGDVKPLPGFDYGKSNDDVVGYDGY